MSAHALHVTDLPEFAAGWPARVVALLDAQLGAEIPEGELRTIVLALSQDNLRLGVWLGAEWENYPYAEGEDEAAGFVALDPWLDALDEIARGERTEAPREAWTPRRPIRFVDPAREQAFGAWWGRLHDALVATAIEVATVHLAARFRQPVGVFVSTTGQEASLVAFCHPQGAPLWPVQEHRKEHGYGSAYPFAAITAEALVIFYPEGEGEDDGPPCVRVYPAHDLIGARQDDDELFVRWRGEAFDVRFSGGHTREESGGPNQAQVEAALLAWAAATGRLQDPTDTGAAASAPTTAAELRAALDAAGPGDTEHMEAIRRLALAHGPAQIGRLIADLDLPQAARGRLHRTVALEALDAEDWGTALFHIESVEGKDRWNWIEMRALVGLGRWQDVLRIAEEDDKAEHALALGGLGRTEEALALLDEARDADARAVKARLLADEDPEAAAGAWARALVLGPRGHLRVHVASHPALQATSEAHARTAEVIEAGRAAAAEVALAGLDTRGAVALVVPPPERVMVAPLLKEGAEAPDLSLWLGLPRGVGAWATDRKGGLFALSPDAAPATLTTFEACVDALEPTEYGVAVSAGGQLHLLDEDGKPSCDAHLPTRGDGPLAAHGGLLAAAANDVLHLYQVGPAALVWRGGLGVPGGSHISGLGFLEPGVLLVSAHRALMVVDVSDPSAPAVRWRTESGAELLTTQPGAAVLNEDGHALLVRWTGEALVCTHRLKLGHTPIPATWRGAAGHVIAWRGGVAQIDEGRVTALGTLGTDGYPLEPRALWLDGEGGLAVTSEGLLPLTARSLEAERVKAEANARASVVADWAEAEIRGHEHAGPELDGAPTALGGVVLVWSDTEAQLRLQPPTSVVGLGYHDGPERALEPEAAQVEAEAPASSAGRRQHKALGHARNELRQAILHKASVDLLRGLASRVQGALSTRDFVLAVEGGAGFTVVEVVPGGGAVAPRRGLSSQRAPQTLAVMMQGSSWYNHLSAWTARARVDAAFREEVLELLRGGGVAPAARVALGLVESHLEPVAEAFLTAAEVDLRLALGGLNAAAQRGHPGAIARLEAVIEGGPAAPALAARLALGRADEEGTVVALREHLADVVNAAKLPLRSLAALSEPRLAQLQTELQTLYEALESPEALLPALVRAGWAPDEAVRALAAEQVGQEDDFMAGMFGEDEDESASEAVRIWVARQVADGLAGEGPLWPADAPIETKRVGWQRFFAVAWPLWTGRGALPRLFEVLPARAAAVAEATPPGPDAKLAFQVLYQALLRGTPGASALGAALESVPWDEAARADVVRLARLGRLKLGWALVTAERYAEARQIADAALADAPEDGQVRFFDARLAWLQAKDPSAAIPRIEAGLSAADDGVGRARLQNLHGAALDALGQTEAALVHFEAALATNEATRDSSSGRPQDAEMSASILSNIAESHWKLGRHDEARRFAETAARRGSTTDIVKLVLASA